MLVGVIEAVLFGSMLIISYIAIIGIENNEAIDINHRVINSSGYIKGAIISVMGSIYRECDLIVEVRLKG